MAYAQQSDLSPTRISASELVQLTDDTNSGLANAAVVTNVLNGASALIESYCGQRYTVPLQPSQQLLDLCLDIAEYKLYLRRKRMKTDVRQAYEDAIAFLKDVSSGKARLDQPTTATPQVGAGDVQVTRVPERFTDDHLAAYVPEENETSPSDDPDVNTTGII
jgi:phage gp36-like protein